MSIVDQASLGGVLRDHVNRIRGLERSGAPQIYVGTVGVDGIDGLITPMSPPFVTGTHTDVTDPVRFWRLDGHIYTAGGFTGVSPGDVVFVYPVGYRPPIEATLLLPSKDATLVHTVLVGTDGQALYVGSH